ncbi:MAG: glycosyltransferase family 2 protein [Spirulina sp.]
MMKISVVIPAYNSEAWLEQALASVAAQTYAAYEVIGVDDGSTDATLAQLQAHPVVTRVLQTEHSGPAVARNAGIAAATGDWVAFLDADDWWHPTHLDQARHLLESGTDVVYLGAAEHFSINVNRVVSRSDVGPFQQPTAGLNHGTYFQLYLKHGLLELSSLVAQRERLQAIGGFVPGLRGAEDLDLMLRLVLDHTWAYDPIPATVYRCNNPQSYSRTAQASADRLTAKLRTFINHQQSYAISPTILQSLARTTMSKVVMGCPRAERRRIQALTRPYLSTQEHWIFALATEVPWAYRWLNELRNRQRPPSYRPRQVVAPSDSRSSQPSP